MQLPTRNQLLRIDEALADNGIPAFNRPDAAMKLWMTQTGDLAIFREDEWFEERFREMHPSVDYAPRPFVTLCASAGAISYFVHPPIVLGTTFIKPIEAVRITELELTRLYRRHESEFWEMNYQAVDATDLFLGDLDLHSPVLRAQNMLQTGMHQLGASARQLVAGEIDSSLPQGMCLATELIGKAVAVHAARGAIDEKKAFRHNLDTLFGHICNVLVGPNDVEVQKVLTHMPRYEDVRYDAPIMTFIDAQNYFRAALFLCAEALRRTKHDQIYWKILSDGSMPPRVW